MSVKATAKCFNEILHIDHKHRLAYLTLTAVMQLSCIVFEMTHCYYCILLHPFTSIFSMTTRVSQHYTGKKGKPFWILPKQICDILGMFIQSFYTQEWVL